MAFITWIQTNWYAVAQAFGYIVLFAGAVVAFFNGPPAEKAKTIIDRILLLLRQIGIGTFKDEPGTVSMPFKGDSKKRVTATKDV